MADHDLVAIRDGRIVEIDKVAGAGAQEIDARESGASMSPIATAPPSLISKWCSTTAITSTNSTRAREAGLSPVTAGIWWIDCS